MTALLALILSPLALPQEDPTPHAALEARLERLRTELAIPGLAAGIVQKGELAWSAGLGHADRENGIPVTLDTPFHLASLTKTFASVVLMRLVEEGALELDTPMRELGVTLSGSEAVTVRHVFSHTSEGTPGEYYRYNGNRFGSLDQVLVEVLGIPFEDILGELILEPLELSRTGRATNRLEPKLAVGYVRNDAGEMVRGRYPSHFGVSAGMVSSIRDLARFYTQVQEHELLEEESFLQAITPTRSTLGHDLPYGLGWFTEDYLGTRVLWHYGWWTCVSSLVVIVPEHEQTFLVLSNTDHLSRSFGLGAGHGTLLGSPFALAFFKELAPALLSEPWPEIDWNASNAEIAPVFAGVRDDRLRELLERELWAQVCVHTSAGRDAERERLVQLYAEVTRAWAPALDDSLDDSPLVARVAGLGADRDVTTEFTCATEGTYRVVGVGELREAEWVDHGWIENAQGEVIWRMSADTATHAGGIPANRRCSAALTLPAGDYRLRYKTNFAHDSDGWYERPPHGLVWGLALLKAPTLR